MLQVPGVMPRELGVDFFPQERNAIVETRLPTPGFRGFGLTATGPFAVEQEAGGEEGKTGEESAEGDGDDQGLAGNNDVAAFEGKAEVGGCVG